MGKRKRVPVDPITDARNCQRCALATTRRSVVPFRLIGEAPASILIIGLAPGRSEDMKGSAMVGPSGALLNRMLEKCGLDESVLVTNAVMCRPCDERGGDNREPSPTEVLTCRRNVTALIQRLSPCPRLVLFLGQVVDRYFRQEYPTAVSLLQPAYLLKTGGTGSPHYQGQLRRLETLVRR